MPVDQAALSSLEQCLRDGRLEVISGEPMRLHTSYRIGGPADRFVTVREARELALAVDSAVQCSVPYFLLGGGTNVLFGDRGYRGLVIRNRCDGITLNAPDGRPASGAHVDLKEMLSVGLLAESGVSLAALARRMASQGLGGLTWAEGIPGTLGGAIVNNAGAFGASISEVVLEVEWLDEGGTRSAWKAESLGFGYRTSRLRNEKGVVVLAASLELSRQDPGYLLGLGREYADRRKRSQPSGASAGSVFKNPIDSFAGRLIEEVGLKGRRVGGAYVSPKHGNFIMNEGDATAQDVLTLIDEIRDKVREQLGTELELEIELAGEF